MLRNLFKTETTRVRKDRWLNGNVRSIKMVKCKFDKKTKIVRDIVNAIKGSERHKKRFR